MYLSTHMSTYLSTYSSIYIYIYYHTSATASSVRTDSSCAISSSRSESATTMPPCGQMTRVGMGGDDDFDY